MTTTAPFATCISANEIRRKIRCVRMPLLQPGHSHYWLHGRRTTVRWVLSARDYLKKNPKVKTLKGIRFPLIETLVAKPVHIAAPIISVSSDFADEITDRPAFDEWVNSLEIFNAEDSTGGAGQISAVAPKTSLCDTSFVIATIGAQTQLQAPGSARLSHSPPRPCANEGQGRRCASTSAALIVRSGCTSACGCTDSNVSLANSGAFTTCVCA